jgi:hypothetical protein
MSDWSRIPGAQSVDADTYLITRDGVPVVGAVYDKRPTNSSALPGVDRDAPMYSSLSVNTNWVNPSKKLKKKSK